MSQQVLTTPIAVACHCGAVKLVVPHAPATVTSCNCSLCHAYGHICAYYSQSAMISMPAMELTQIYVLGDKGIAFHRCIHCGCQTHWVGIDPDSTTDRMAVNARLMPRDVLAAAKVRRFDGWDTWQVLDEDFKWAYCPMNKIKQDVPATITADTSIA